MLSFPSKIFLSFEYSLAFVSLELLKSLILLILLILLSKFLFFFIFKNSLTWSGSLSFKAFLHTLRITKEAIKKVIAAEKKQPTSF